MAQGAAAQEGFRVEVVPSVGYRTGATLNESASGAEYDVEPSASWGALVVVTRIEAPGSAVTRFTAALSGGVKLMASRSFGARLEARALGVFSGGSAGGLCGPQGCTVGLSGWGTLQADLSAGVLVAF